MGRNWEISMKQKICERCAHYKRCKWSKAYKPTNYHAIGMTFAYGYCLKHKKRCLEVNRCELTNKKYCNTKKQER